MKKAASVCASGSARSRTWLGDTYMADYMEVRLADLGRSRTCVFYANNKGRIGKVRELEHAQLFQRSNTLDPGAGQSTARSKQMSPVRGNIAFLGFTKRL